MLADMRRYVEGNCDGAITGASSMPYMPFRRREIGAANRFAGIRNEETEVPRVICQRNENGKRININILIY